jgi:hypothetical protein
MSMMGRTPVSDKYKRMRFTLRHRTGGGAEAGLALFALLSALFSSQTPVDVLTTASWSM